VVNDSRPCCYLLFEMCLRLWCCNGALRFECWLCDVERRTSGSFVSERQVRGPFIGRNVHQFHVVACNVGFDGPAPEWKEWCSLGLARCDCSDDKGRNVFASAPLLNDSCAAVSYSETSVSFTWWPATSAADVTYYLSDGTAVLANSTTTSATVDNLAAGAEYTYWLYAIASGSNSTSQSVSCTGWTGE
jgi:hypothetical protein